MTDRNMFVWRQLDPEHDELVMRREENEGLQRIIIALRNENAYLRGRLVAQAHAEGRPA